MKQEDILKKAIEKYEITDTGRVFNKKTNKELKTYINYLGNLINLC